MSTSESNTPGGELQPWTDEDPLPRPSRADRGDYLRNPPVVLDPRRAAINDRALGIVDTDETNPPESPSNLPLEVTDVVYTEQQVGRLVVREIEFGIQPSTGSE